MICACFLLLCLRYKLPNLRYPLAVILRKLLECKTCLSSFSKDVVIGSISYYISIILYQASFQDSCCEAQK